MLKNLNGEKNTESHLFYKKSPVCDLLFLEISPSPENPRVQLSVDSGQNSGYVKVQLPVMDTPLNMLVVIGLSNKQDGNTPNSCQVFYLRDDNFDMIPMKYS